MNGRPSQCYLFKSCGRKVENATFDCMLNKENTLEVHPFVDTESECEIHCQEVSYFQLRNFAIYPKILNVLPFEIQNRKCGYYKYFSEEDETRGQFCYLLKSCAKRMVDNMNCPLGKNNFLEVKFFVPTVEMCGNHCRDTAGCRYYWWYPIENSENPLYCYLFQQCATSDNEPEAALIIGGRHPGHYFMTEAEHNDLVMRYVRTNALCSRNFQNVKLRLDFVEI